jgi:hypothetical protein
MHAHAYDKSKVEKKVGLLLDVSAHTHVCALNLDPQIQKSDLTRACFWLSALKHKEEEQSGNCCYGS